MNVSTKELRIQPGRIIDQAANGEEITVTYRGKALVRIVPINESNGDRPISRASIFGMWKDRGGVDVENTVRAMRLGRRF